MVKDRETWRAIVHGVAKSQIQLSKFHTFTLDYNPPGSSVLGILQARILEWVAISSPFKGSIPDPAIKPRCLRCPELTSSFLPRCRLGNPPAFSLGKA